MIKREALFRVAGAFTWVVFIAGFAEMSYQTAVITNVWIYSLFVFQAVAAIFGATVILFASPTITTKGTDQ